MYQAPGVGLAAPQIGLPLRFFVYDARDGAERGTVANPVIVESEGEVIEEEGCLSVPSLWYPTARAQRVVLEGLDVRGRQIRLEGEGLLARIFQHETDHLNGLLYLDRLPEEDRRRAMAELRELELGGNDRGRFRTRSGR
jgi:peptide deformylase